MAGLATCTLTHITEVPASREIVAALIGQTTTPQVLIRVGLAPAIEDAPPATPRRPIDDVFEFNQGTNDRATGTFASERQAHVERTMTRSGATCKCISRHRPPSSSASTVHDPRSMPPVGRRRSGQSRYPVAARLRHRPRQCRRHRSPGCGTRPRHRRNSGHGTRSRAVESTDKPVKIEVEILQDATDAALLDASRWAAMLCVGSMGLKHSAQGRIGSTAAALAASAHCPVAIIRGHDPRRARTRLGGRRGGRVCRQRRRRCGGARGGAASRGAAARADHLAVTVHRHSRLAAVADGNRLAKAQLDRRLAQWKKRYPDLDVQAVAVHGSTLNYLAKNASSIQLLVVGHERAHGIRELVGPPGYAALHNAGLFGVDLRTAERIVSTTSTVVGSIYGGPTGW